MLTLTESVKGITAREEDLRSSECSRLTRLNPVKNLRHRGTTTSKNKRKGRGERREEMDDTRPLLTECTGSRGPKRPADGRITQSGLRDFLPDSQG